MCSPALGTLRQIRRSNSQREQRSNFAPYPTGDKKKAKKQSWTVRFVCLDSTNATSAPCTPSAKEKLVAAGLGEKKFTIPDTSCSKNAFNDAILELFPRLRESGGYELLKCVPNSKQLEIVSSRISQSPSLLRSVVGNGRVFIRPVQNNLSLVPEERLSSSPEVSLKN